MKTDNVLVDYEKLKEFVSTILTKAGLDEFSCECVTKGLTEASLRGTDSHGVRLLPHYVASARSGRKNPTPQFKVEKKYPTICSLDADNAFGHAAGMKAIDTAMAIAEEFGVGIVSVKNSSHPGAMASFALRAARQGFLAFAFTHADSLMLSHGGNRPYFGTNPVCFAAPRKNEDPYCLDMSTTETSWNTVLLSRTNKTTLPEGLAADQMGEITTDPERATCLMPIGRYKGQGLASMVEILCSLYSGMNFGRKIPSMYKTPMETQRKLGQFYIVMKPDGARSYEDFLEDMGVLSQEVRAEPSKNGDRVMLPGDKEMWTAQERKVKGIPIDGLTFEKFNELAREFGVENL